MNEIIAERLDDILTTDPTDRECCEPHGCPLPCEECRKNIEDHWAELEE